MPTQSSVTVLLRQASLGDKAAFDLLLPLVYDELRRRASAKMRSERPAHTLGTTGLVHEAVLRLAAQDQTKWTDSDHFFAVASMVMRRILVNWARDRARIKRGGNAQTALPIDEADIAAEAPDHTTVLAVDSALERLMDLSARAARVVECRYFAGLSVDETARCLKVSPATVKREWRLARAWLLDELSSHEAADFA